ncbi:MAG: LysM peptidoglycan-binding domain-containing protein [Omnitrophica WOR_2 bacterium]
MKNWKRLFYYLVINVLVSACVTYLVLTLWSRAHPETAGSLGSLLSFKATATPQNLPLSDPQETLTSTIVISATATTEALVTYQVQAGETLSEIAEKFGVPVEKLAQLNGITDPKSLGSGQVLFVPKSPSDQPTTPVSTDTPASPASTSPVQSQQAEVVIANVFGAGDLNTERVRLECKGQGELSLAGWQLKDENGNVFTFPQLILYPGGAIDIHTGTGVNDVVSLYWGLKKSIWTTGEIVTLLDAKGATRATYSVP